MVYDPLRKSHGAFDKAVKGAGGSTRQGGDLQKLKDAVKLHPLQAKKKRKIPSVNA